MCFRDGGVRDLKGGRAPFEPDSKVLGWQTRKFDDLRAF